MAADDVQLPDLEVIQRYSLAVRSAAAPRADVIAALQADLDWLTSLGNGPAAPTRTPARTTARTPAKATSKTPAKAASSTPAPPKRTARRAPAKRTPPSEA